MQRTRALVIGRVDDVLLVCMREQSLDAAQMFVLARAPQRRLAIIVGGARVGAERQQECDRVRLTAHTRE